MRAPVATGLEALVGADRVIRGTGRLAGWAVSGRPPDAVVFPETVEQLADVMGRASEEGWPVVPAGSGGWLAGGGAPEEARLVVSTREMASVVEHEPGDLTLSAEAGLPLARLQEVAGEAGQWLPQDPPGWRDATLGGFVSTGLPGPLVAGFGRPRDQLLGLTAVTGDGRIVRPGGRVVKNVAGYDLVRLLTGSWGTLAVIAGATVRLFPRPERDTTLLFREGTASDLVEIGRALATAPVAPEALELLAPPPGLDTPDAAEGVRPEGGVVAARLLGSEDAVAGKSRILAEAAGRPPDRSLEAGESAAFHDRSAATPDEALALRLSLLPARLGRLVELGEQIRDRARAGGSGVRLAGHVTRGVLRVEVRRPGGGPAPVEEWVRVLSDLRARLEEDGGSLRVVRAPREVGGEVDTGGTVSGGVSRILRGLKEEFDPAGVLAPDRLGLGGAGP